MPTIVRLQYLFLALVLLGMSLLTPMVTVASQTTTTTVMTVQHTDVTPTPTITPTPPVNNNECENLHCGRPVP